MGGLDGSPRRSNGGLIKTLHRNGVDGRTMTCLNPEIIDSGPNEK